MKEDFTVDIEDIVYEMAIVEERISNDILLLAYSETSLIPVFYNGEIEILDSLDSLDLSCFWEDVNPKM